MSAPLLVDSHCHLDFPDFVGREIELLAEMRRNDIGWALIAGVTLERFPAVRLLAETYAPIFAAVGVHPDTEGEDDAGRPTFTSSCIVPACACANVWN